MIVKNCAEFHRYATPAISTGRSGSWRSITASSKSSTGRLAGGAAQLLLFQISFDRLLGIGERGWIGLHDVERRVAIAIGWQHGASAVD